MLRGHDERHAETGGLEPGDSRATMLVVDLHQNGGVGSRLASPCGGAANSNRALFESVDEGVACIELIFDADGVPVDFRWLDYNAAFSRHTGLSNVRARRGREVFPDLDAQVLDIHARVADSGEGARFERYARNVDRWFSIFASPVSGNLGQVVVLFADVTERKRAKEALRDSEARNAYLVRLGDTLRPLADPALVERAAIQVLSEQLGANGAFYGEFDGEDLPVEEVYVRDTAPMPLGRYKNTPRAGWMRCTPRAGYPRRRPVPSAPTRAKSIAAPRSTPASICTWQNRSRPRD